MKSVKVFSILGGATLLAAGAALMAGAGQAAPIVATASVMAAAEDSPAYTIDAVHSSLIFKIKHLNVSSFYGRFNKVSGKFMLNAEDPSKSVLEVKADTESVDTNNAGRDKHVKSQDFFSAKEFPEISFVGKEFKKKGDAFEVTGDLTLKGKTKSITVTVADTGKGPGMRGGEVAGVESTFTFKRSDFGMDFMLKGLSDEVTIMFGAEGSRS
jgi:polyisoprenoid-binding protein YceI